MSTFFGPQSPSPQDLDEQVADELAAFDFPEDAFSWLVDRFDTRRDVDHPPPEAQAIEGCASALLVLCKPQAENESRLYLRAWSDSILPRVLSGLLVHLYDGQLIESCAAFRPECLDSSGLRNSLTTGRRNAWDAMIDHVTATSLNLTRQAPAMRI